MKRWKKAALVALALFLLFQIPFIYRRIRLGNLRSAIRGVNSERVADDATSPYVNYAGVIHVHSALGGHSLGHF